MLTLKKIIENNNEPIKYNFDWLVYEHNHDDIVDCKTLGHEFYGDKYGCPDSYDEKEIKWKISGYRYLEIIRLKYTVSQKITTILASEATFMNLKKNYVLKVCFHFIDKEGNRIDKHLIL